MTQEEKYKEALERASKLRVQNPFDTVGQMVEHIFPELKESEDERKRKAILTGLIDCRDAPDLGWSNFGGINIDECITWLEKQGEKKPTLPKWKYKKDHTPLLRDSIILNKYGCVAKSPAGAIVSDVWVLDYDELTKLPKEVLEKQGEGRSTIFIPKFRLGDKLVSTKNPRLTYEVLEVGHINELGNPEYKVEIFTDGKAKNPHNTHYMECCKVDEWAKLIEHKPADKVEPKFKVGDWI